MLKIWIKMRNIPVLILAENTDHCVYSFSSCIFVPRFQDMVLKLHTELTTVTGVLKNDRLCLNI